MIEAINTARARPDRQAEQGDFNTELRRAETAGAGQGPAQSWLYDESALWPPGGDPRSDDIDQDRIGDCGFLATLAAFAQQQPDLIKKSIAFDPQTGDFAVTLYNAAGPVRIRVTQYDIMNNISRRGGGRIDNYPGMPASGIWPSVIETAYAKMRDVNWANGLDQGYKRIEGTPIEDAMYLLSGKRGERLTLVWRVQSSLRQIFGPRSESVLQLVRGPNETCEAVKRAMAEGRPVVLFPDAHYGGKQPNKQDGLAFPHAYSVVHVSKNADGEYGLLVRNPWGHNVGVGEGKDSQGDLMLIKASELHGDCAFIIGQPRAHQAAGAQR